MFVKSGVKSVALHEITKVYIIVLRHEDSQTWSLKLIYIDFGYPPSTISKIKYLHMYLLIIKTESSRKLSNFTFQWTRTLYQNNLKNNAFFFTFFKG